VRKVGSDPTPAIFSQAPDGVEERPKEVPTGIGKARLVGVGLGYDQRHGSGNGRAGL